MTKETEIKAIEKQILMVSIMDIPGVILLGLGLYAKLGTQDDAFHPLLNDPNIVTSMLVLGSAIMAWGGYKIFTLSREKDKLTNMS
ncbi:hypothetical protein ACU6U9_12685 [Pseudomonas sp. HK3]